MNKFEEEIEKRYGSFELSHDKNKLITDDIKSFTADVAVKFGEWLGKERYIKFDIFENQMSSTHYKYERWDKSYKNSFEIDESETKTTEELFEIFINNHYGK